MPANTLPLVPFWAMLPASFDNYKAQMPELYASLRREPSMAHAEIKARKGVYLTVKTGGNAFPSSLAPALNASLGKGLTQRQIASFLLPREGKIVGKKKADETEEESEEVTEDAYAMILEEVDEDERPPYNVMNGVALISLEGPMTKHPTSAMWMYGGTSTLMLRQDIRHALANDRVQSILISADSPGGNIMGVNDLSEDVRKGDARKPIEVHVADLCASACYWAVSHARKITASQSAMVGSIGTYMVVEDYSKLAAKNGIEVTVIRAGEFKGAGVDFTEVTGEQKQNWQREIDELNAQFLNAVQAGRGFTAAQTRSLNDGRVHVGEAALRLGLVDAIQDYDTVLTRMMQENEANADAALDEETVRGQAGFFGAMTRRMEDFFAGATALLSSGRVPGELAQTLALGEAFSNEPRSSEDVATEPLPTDVETPATETDIEDPASGVESSTIVGSEIPETTPPGVDGVSEPTETEGEPAETSASLPVENQTVDATVAASALTALGVTSNTENEMELTQEQRDIMGALEAAGITTAAQFAETLIAAADGREARSLQMEALATQMTRARGAEAMAGKNLANLYGSFGMKDLREMTAEMKAVADAKLSHPVQADGTKPAAGVAATADQHELAAQQAISDMYAKKADATGDTAKVDDFIKTANANRAPVK